MEDPVKIRELREKAMKLPQTPGVYIMKNKAGEIIYIGKAKKLKNRVSQYFGSHTNHTTKVIKMVGNVNDFDYILVDSEFEALVLEASLIKLHRPKYNILLKDDKGYNYIRIENNGWRKIAAVMQKKDDGAEYLGPYTSSYYTRQAVEEACAIYRLPTCSKIFPRDCGKSRPCLNFYIKKCCAPCSGKVKENEYEKNVGDAIKFLTGSRSDILAEMEKEMNDAAENLEFEKAAVLRDRISGIKKVSEKQHVVSQKVKEQDVFAFAVMLGKACLNVMRFTEGRLYENEFFFMDDPENLPAARAEIIMSYYAIRDNIPPRITVDGETEDSALISELLSKRAGRKVSIVQPERGEQTKLVALSKKNAEEKLAQSRGRADKDSAALDELAEILGLEKAPEYIESYDISHTAGSDNVAGMIVYKNGKPYKKAYKHFAIKGFEGQDDYASMNEVLARRFGEYEKHKGEEGFGTLPDLILLDGSQGQVNAVAPVLESFGIDVPLFGMVKDSKHRTRAIATGGSEINIDSKRKAFVLLGEIQEEVHRFAVSYHRQKHAKSSIGTSLTEIDGIGEKKAKNLLIKFRSVKAISKAGIAELTSVPGIGEKDALNIIAYFKDKNV